jgi:ribonuclease HII
MTKVNILHIPSFAEEEKLIRKGYRYIAGIDEVGRGALAGPVVAAAVILPCRVEVTLQSQVKDSKLLSPDKRDRLFDIIQMTAISIGVGIVSQQIIDNHNIIWATRLAMKRAIEQLSPSADTLLIDYLNLPDITLPQKGIVNGDSHCLSIACASIIAKVTRDYLMIEMDAVYPGYNLGVHKGYGTKRHITYLNRLGPSPIHRRSFFPVKGMLLKGR